MADFTPVKAGVWCDEGKNSLLDVYLKGAPIPILYLGLYLNATEPLATATLASIQEPGGGDYTRQILQPEDWTIGDLAEDYPDPTDVRRGVAKHVEKTFLNIGTAWGDIYGFFICTSIAGTDGKLIRVEHFLDGPYNVAVGGGMRILPQISAS